MEHDAAHADQHDGPVLLFDGVCNLCDASVRFVIDRDLNQRFRFASLQSQAAREALDAAGAPAEMPDSVVLIDRDGVHTRSTAAIRVAGRLGLPYALLTLALVIPRPLRDAVYSWIARHRYRWFGRQNACRMPTPEERALFLDADEPAPVIDVDADPQQDERPGRALGLATLPTRFLLIYPIIFMAPFPITLLSLLFVIPGASESWLAAPVGFVMGLHGMVMQAIVGPLGQALTGAEMSFQQTGSGDRLVDYLDVSLDLLLALLITVAWWAWRRAKPITLGVADTARILLRYYLAYVMFAYGFAKVFPLQFPGAGPDRLLQPYGDSSPMGLLWTFMGASAGYQMFAGAAEALGGLLLLFRRTTLLGAFVVTAVMTNVFAMNMFFDVPVKLYSFHYLIFAVILMLPDLPRLVGLLLANVPVAPRPERPIWAGSPRLRTTVGVAKAVLIGAMLYSSISSGFAAMHQRGPWAPPHELRAIYSVESFTIDGEPGADAERWVRVGLNPPWVATVQSADGAAVRMRMQVDLDAATIAIFDRGLQEPPDPPMAFDRLDDGALRIGGVFQGRLIDAVLRPVETESLLKSRGFRWINEYPFNR